MRCLRRARLAGGQPLLPVARKRGTLGRREPSSVSPRGRVPGGRVTARDRFSRNQYDGACPPERAARRHVVAVDAMPTAEPPLDATALAARVGVFVTTGAPAHESQEVIHEN